MARTGAPVQQLEHAGGLWPQAKVPLALAGRLRAASLPLPAAMQELLDSFEEFEPEPCCLDLPHGGAGAGGPASAPAKRVPWSRETRTA